MESWVRVNRWAWGATDDKKWESWLINLNWVAWVDERDLIVAFEGGKAITVDLVSWRQITEKLGLEVVKPFWRGGAPVSYRGENE